MALVLADRVKETTTTTGTGTLTLAGAATGFQSFSVIGNGNTTYYAISSSGSSEWEVGIGTYTSSGTTLARTTIIASSNAGSAVNLSAGTKDVFVTSPASKTSGYPEAGIPNSTGSAWGTSKAAPSGDLVGTSDTQTLTSKTISGASNTLTVDGTNAVGFRGIPSAGTSKTSSYTLAVADRGEFVEIGSGGSITVPTSTFASGDAVVLFNNTTGNITITCSAPTTYVGGTNTTRTSVTLATRGICNVLFVTPTLVVITGNVT